MELSDKIRIIRKARGFSQEGLGDSLSMTCESGISRQSVSDWENGKTEPKLNNIRDLAKVLNVSYDALLDETLDLTDTNVLTAVLNKLNTENKSQVNSKFRYKLYANAVTVKSYINCIICGICLLLAICFAFLINFWDGFIIFTYLCGLLFFVLFTPSIIRLISISKGKVAYCFGELNNTHLIINTAQTAENTLYVPIEKIENIKLGYRQKKKHGNVEIKILGRAKPLILNDIMNPQNFIDTFSNLSNYAQMKDEIKIL